MDITRENIRKCRNLEDIHWRKLYNDSIYSKKTENASSIME